MKKIQWFIELKKKKNYCCKLYSRTGLDCKPVCHYIFVKFRILFLSNYYLAEPNRRLASPAVYVIALFVLSFLGVIGNTVVSLIHGSEQSQDHEQSRSLSASAGDISQEKQVDLFTCDQFFKTARRRRRSVSGEEEAGNPAIRCADQNQNESNTHLVRVESGSKAAKVNFACLVLSALCLFGCTLGAFMQII